MNIVIFGANGPTGRLLTKQALDEGHIVTAFTRNAKAFPLRNDRLQVMQGDVFNLSSVEQAVDGKDAVLSTLGVTFSREPITVYSKGISHIIQAMNRYKVRRLVCVTSSAVEPQFDPKGSFIFERILQPLIIRTIGRTTYEDMSQMESLVMNSDLDWTIIRPSGLFETQAVTPYKVTEEHINGSRFTSRTDLADCMLKQIKDNQFLRKIVLVATFAEKPSMLQFFMQGKNNQ